MLKGRKDTEIINLNVSGTSNSKAMILSKCAICGIKKWRFINSWWYIHAWFTYSACGPLIKNKERIQIFKEAGDANYTYIHLTIHTLQKWIWWSLFSIW